MREGRAWLGFPRLIFVGPFGGKTPREDLKKWKREKISTSGSEEEKSPFQTVEILHKIHSVIL